MEEDIAFENGRIFDFQGLMTVTLDRVILHTVMHQSLTSAYIPNFLKSKKLFVDGYLLPTSKSRDTKTGTKNQKSGPDKR